MILLEPGFSTAILSFLPWDSLLANALPHHRCRHLSWKPLRGYQWYSCALRCCRYRCWSLAGWLPFRYFRQLPPRLLDRQFAGDGFYRLDLDRRAKASEANAEEREKPKLINADITFLGGRVIGGVCQSKKRQKSESITSISSFLEPFPRLVQLLFRYNQATGNTELESKSK